MLSLAFIPIMVHKKESIDYTTIKKQASDINSAASSILCRQLAKSAENVEIAARSASNDDNFKDCLEKLNIAFTNFQSYLENLGVWS